MVAKSQLKKVLKIFTREQHKSSSASAKEKEDAEIRAKNLEEARKVKLTVDKTYGDLTIPA